MMHHDTTARARRNVQSGTINSRVGWWDNAAPLLREWLALEVVGMLIPWSLGLVDRIDPMVARSLFWWFGHPLPFALAVLALPVGVLAGGRGGMLAAAALPGSAAVLLLLSEAAAPGIAAVGLWLYVLGLALLAWRAMEALAAARGRTTAFAVPLLFGLGILFAWEVAVTGFGFGALAPVADELAELGEAELQRLLDEHLFVA